MRLCLPFQTFTGYIRLALQAACIAPYGGTFSHSLDPCFGHTSRYGNVVALAAEQGSICFFDVDHVFPRKRGGRSVLQNFAATHWCVTAAACNCAALKSWTSC